MTKLELIDRLCAIVEMQSRIIREQAIFIEEQISVDQALKEHFAKKRDEIDSELDLLEYQMRPIHNTASESANDNEEN